MTDLLPPDDTSPEAQRVLAGLYARMSPAAKLQCMQQITRSANQLALAGLRRRNPGDTESELLLRLARMRLGDDIIDAVYSPQTPRRGA
ncbi:MAG: hypothetical protein C0497_06520 [Gemmatimonas sp.]|nr:hypothetical protein [Gemmatimonas sp.]